MKLIKRNFCIKVIYVNLTYNINLFKHNIFITMYYFQKQCRLIQILM